MEGGVVAALSVWQNNGERSSQRVAQRVHDLPAHRPDDTDKTHEDTDARRKSSASIDIAPDLLARRESRQILLLTIGSSRDQDDHNNQSHNIETAAKTVDSSNGLGG